MNERLLQYIWQFQYFSIHQLFTTENEFLQILDPGKPNTNQGPDFLFAKIKIGETLFVGSVELHLKTSDWKKHRHEGDKNYRNIILHVVWENDVDEFPIPTFELKHRVAKILLQRYKEWMLSNTFIPCEVNIQQVPNLIVQTWKDRLLIERLIRKSLIISQYQQLNKNHWEEIFWWTLAQNFGMGANAQSFLAIAKSIPLSVLHKYQHNLVQLEALLMGQAGLLLEEFKDFYPQVLKKEYSFIQAKHNLSPIQQSVFFLRMRPRNFPTIRLAQLANLLHHSSFLFSKVKEVESIKNLKKLFQTSTCDYWNHHYCFDEPSLFQEKKLGTMLMQNLIINTVAPVLFAYGEYHQQAIYKERALLFLATLPPETNSILKKFELLKMENKHAADSQALLELKNEYCDKKRCLDCSIGNSILKMQVSSNFPN